MPVFKNPFTSYGGSAFKARAVAFEIGTEAQDATQSGDGYRQSDAGLNTWAAEIEVNWSSTIAAIFGTTAGKTGSFVFRETTAAQSATNHQYTGSAIRTSVSFGESVGNQHVANITLVAGGDLTIAST